MSQDCYFYKQKCLPEEVARNFENEKVYNALKALFVGKDLEEEGFIDKYFEQIELKYIDFSAYKPDKIIPDFSKKLKLLSDESRFFMVDENVWTAIKEIVLKPFDDALSQKSENKIDRDKLLQLLGEYSRLENLFKSNMLFVNMF